MMYVRAGGKEQQQQHFCVTGCDWMDGTCLSVCIPPLFSFSLRTHFVASCRDYRIAAARGHAVATFHTTVVPLGT